MQTFNEARFNTEELSRLLDTTPNLIENWESKGIIKSRAESTKKTHRKEFSIEDVLSARAIKPYPLARKKVQVFANVKGGVGKSTLSSQYLMRASMLGLRCLAIDLDPQAHLTYHLGFEGGESTPTIFDVLIDKVPIEKVIQKINPALSIIPSNLNLTLTESRLFHENKREFRFRDALSRIKPLFDIIVADTNPSISLLNLSMFIAADEIIIVSATDFLSFHGLKLMFDQLEDIVEDFDISPKIRVIPNLFDVRDGICLESLGALKKHYRDRITKTVVRKNTDLREASKIKNSIFFTKRNSSGRKDIESLTRELLK